MISPTWQTSAIDAVFGSWKTLHFSFSVAKQLSSTTVIDVHFSESKNAST